MFLLGRIFNIFSAAFLPQIFQVGILVVLTQGQFCDPTPPPGDIWQCLELYLVSQLAASSHKCVKARDAGRYLTMYRIVFPTMKNYLIQNVNSAEVENTSLHCTVSKYSRLTVYSHLPVQFFVDFTLFNYKKHNRLDHCINSTLSCWIHSINVSSRSSFFIFLPYAMLSNISWVGGRCHFR